MERLTLDEAVKYIKEVVRKNRKNKEKNTIVIPNSFISNADCAEKYEQVAKWLEELKSYKEAEEQDLLVRLPCKLNGTLYSVNYSNKTIAENTIIKISINDHVKRFYCIDDNLRERIFFSRRIGENVFLTREEAEKKLEELKNEI
jgi:hypothetical protein